MLDADAECQRRSIVIFSLCSEPIVSNLLCIYVVDRGGMVLVSRGVLQQLSALERSRMCCESSDNHAIIAILFMLILF